MAKKMKVEFAPSFEMPKDPEARKLVEAFIKKMQSMDAVDVQVADDMGVIDLGDDIGECKITKLDIDEEDKTKH